MMMMMMLKIKNLSGRQGIKNGDEVQLTCVLTSFIMVTGNSGTGRSNRCPPG